MFFQNATIAIHHVIFGRRKVTAIPEKGFLTLKKSAPSLVRCASFAHLLLLFCPPQKMKEEIKKKKLSKTELFLHFLRTDALWLFIVYIFIINLLFMYSFNILCLD